MILQRVLAVDLGLHWQNSAFLMAVEGGHRFCCCQTNDDGQTDGDVVAVMRRQNCQQMYRDDEKAAMLTLL